MRLQQNLVPFVVVFLSGCAVSESSLDQPGTGDDKADQISGNDDPSGLLGNAERRLARLVSAGEVGESFGVPDHSIPYPDTYWPMVDDGIAVEWLEKDGRQCDEPNQCQDPQASPLTKYMLLTDPAAVDQAVAWERREHGSEVPGVADWFGHCPGWAASATLNAPIPGPLYAAFDGVAFRRCQPGSEGCVKFEIGDLNALQAEVYNNADSRFIGARCDTSPADIERDQYGRIVRNGTGCKGLNAGALLIVLGNLLKMEGKPFVIDAQNEFTTDQIWNQPAFRYTVNAYRELDEIQAANLVATGGDTEEGDLGEYIFNSNAHGFVFVDFTLHWVTEAGPNLNVISGADSREQTRMVAVIELDAEPSDPEAEIIGGEYLDDPSVDAYRLRVPPFAWMALDVGSDDFGGHNPFVRGQRVKDLVALALGQ